MPTEFLSDRQRQFVLTILRSWFLYGAKTPDDDRTPDCEDIIRKFEGTDTRIFVERAYLLKKPEEGDPNEQTVERIRASLEGISVALMRTIDAQARQKRPALNIHQDGETYIAQWDGETNEFNFNSFVLRQVIRFGEAQFPGVVTLALSITQMIFYGLLSLPGFVKEWPNNMSAASNAYPQDIKLKPMPTDGSA